MRVQIDNLVQKRGHFVSHEGTAAKQHFPGYARQRPLIGVMINFIDHAGGLFGRHVVRRAHDSRRIGQLGARRLHLGNAEIEHFHEVGLAGNLQQEHVARFEIAVNHALIVGGVQRRGDLPDHV